MLTKKKMTKIVYFKSKLPKANFPHEGLPIALFLWDKLSRKSDKSLYVNGVFDFYDDLRLLIYVENGKSLLTSFIKTISVNIDLTFYRESNGDEFSLMIDRTYENKKVADKILAKIESVLNSDSVFYNIKWEEIK